MKLPTNSNKPYTVRDDDNLTAIGRAYKYLIRDNPLWLINMPGVDNALLSEGTALKAEYRARFAPPLALVSTPVQKARAA
jgi:hypothetical protein